MCFFKIYKKSTERLQTLILKLMVRSLKTSYAAWFYILYLIRIGQRPWSRAIQHNETPDGSLDIASFIAQFMNDK